MPTYVSLINWTEQGIKNFRDTAKRANDFTKLVEGAGGKVREVLWTIGEYDIVSVVDFPDDESAVAALLNQGSRAASGLRRYERSIRARSRESSPEPASQPPPSSHESTCWRRPRPGFPCSTVDSATRGAIVLFCRSASTSRSTRLRGTSSPTP